MSIPPQTNEPAPFVTFPMPLTVYMQGTRRLEEMIWNARQLAFQENYSFTEGWDDNVVAEIFNLALDRLYDALTEVDEPPNIQEVTLDIISQQTEYPIPMDVHNALRIIDVRFLYGPQLWEFITLRQGMIQDRFSYPTNIPDTYCIRNGNILLSPTPNLSRPASLIINYQKRMRKPDIRRGKVTFSDITSKNGGVIGATQANPCQITTAANHDLMNGDTVGLQNLGGMFELNAGNVFRIIVTGVNTFTLVGVDSTLFAPYTNGGNWFQTPIKITLDFTQDSQKDINLQANANSKLNWIDWCCICDRNGNPVIDAMPINNYNKTSEILTLEANYVFPGTSLNTFIDISTSISPTMYLLAGDYSSSHSELDRQCEDHLIEFAILRLLRLQSAAEPTRDQLAAETAVLARLTAAYRRYRPSVVPVIWQERLRPRSWPWGRRGMY